MRRRKEWRLLLDEVRRHGVDVKVIPEEQFFSVFPSGIRSVYDPQRQRIIVHRDTGRRDDVLLFSVAHELGHAIDHISEPEKAREYGLHYHLAGVYDMFSLRCPDESEAIFKEREDMATAIGENILEHLGIPIDPQVRSEHRHR